MSLETGNRIPDLVATNPVGATDFASQGDDHIRLLKACIQGSFPNIGSTPVTATAEEINFVDGVTSNVQTQLDAKLSIAAANAGFQPLDADLTAIAALTTTSFGRGFLDLANLAALATKIAALVPTWTGRHLFTSTAGPVYLQSASPIIYLEATGAPSNETKWRIRAGSGGFVLDSENGAGSDARAALFFQRSGVAIASMVHGNSTDMPQQVFYGRMTINGAYEVAVPAAGQPSTIFTLSNAGAWGLIAGYLNDGRAYIQAQRLDGTTTTYDLLIQPNGGNLILGGVNIKSQPLITSTSTTLAKGQMHHITGNATLPALGNGEWICIVNNSGSDITISEHSGDTTYWSTGQVSISTVTLQARGRMFASGAGSSVVYVTGDITGYT